MEKEAPHRLFPHGHFMVDFERNACILPDGKAVKLTPLELRVFLQFDPQIPISANELAKRVQNVYEAIDDAWRAQTRGRIKWPSYLKSEDHKVTGQHMGVQIYSLRKKLGQNSILSRKWSGYTLGTPEFDSDSPL